MLPRTGTKPTPIQYSATKLVGLQMHATNVAATHWHTRKVGPGHRTLGWDPKVGSKDGTLR